jgi:hypothetical protein
VAGKRHHCLWQLFCLLRTGCWNGNHLVTAVLAKV